MAGPTHFAIRIDPKPIGTALSVGRVAKPVSAVTRIARVRYKANSGSNSNFVESRFLEGNSEMA
jgi:hypothetical protein